VYFCGVRGSTPAPGADFLRYGGHTPCIAIAPDGASVPTLVLDSGTGARAVTALLGGAPFDGTILYSHLHWDHFHGLPFFDGADRDGARTAILVPDQRDGQSALALLERGMSPPHFPITPRMLRGSWSYDTIAPGEHEIEGFKVLALEIPHRGGRTYGYRISDDHSTLVYMPDHSPTTIGDGEDGFGAYHPAAVELASNADALIHDAAMEPAELAAEREYGHAVADYAVGLGARTGVGTVYLFHHKPERTDAELDAIGARFAGSDVAVVVAGQGSVLDL
jgi:phosphoribosyl 1,2-cyclic phosphodiesterase